MLKQYHQECKKIRDNFDTKYASCYYLQPYYRDYIKANNLSIENGTLRSWVKECLDKNGDFSGELFAMSRCKDDYNHLAKKYEKYLAVNPNKHRWIQISPDPKKYPTMLELYKKLCSLNLDNYIANVEAYTQHGYRPHIHMILFDIKTRPNRIIDKLSKHFNCDKNFVECKNSTEFDRNFNYIKGNKSPDKMPNVLLDREERLKEGIPAYIDKR
jgi:hypothetical protein